LSMAKLENPLESPCFGCGPRHRRGLKLSFERHGNEVWCLYTPRRDEVGWPGFIHPGLHYMVLRETCYWGALTLGGKLHGSGGKSVFRETSSPPVLKPFRARSRIKRRTRRGLHMIALSESLTGRPYARFESFYIPVKRSAVKSKGLRLPSYLLEDIGP
jgi:hypothetical protein